MQSSIHNPTYIRVYHNSCTPHILCAVATYNVSIMNDKYTVHVATMEEQSVASSGPPAQKSDSMRRDSLERSDAADSYDHSLQVDETGTVYPSPLKTLVILSGLFMGVFLVALDQTIIGTTIPKITDEFKTIQVLDTQFATPPCHPAAHLCIVSDWSFIAGRGLVWQRILPNKYW